MKALTSKVRQRDDREVLWVEDLVDSVQYDVENRSRALPTYTEQQVKSTVYSWALEFAFAGKVSVNVGEYEAWPKLRAMLQGVVGRASSGQMSSVASEAAEQGMLPDINALIMNAAEGVECPIDEESLPLETKIQSHMEDSEMTTKLAEHLNANPLGHPTTLHPCFTDMRAKLWGHLGGCGGGVVTLESINSAIVGHMFTALILGGTAWLLTSVSL